MTRSTQRFTLLSSTLVELVDADDVPIPAEGWNPGQIWGIPFELVCEMANLQDMLFALTQLADRVSKIRRKICIKEESHAARRLSKATAA